MDAARFLVGGEWRSSATVKPVVNPFSGREAGQVFQAGSKDVLEAIEAACAAFQETRRLTAFERYRALRFTAERIEAEKEAFAVLITAETGKPILYSRVEVERCILTITLAAEEARRVDGMVLPLDIVANARDRMGLVRRFPLGPIGAITPFNFPLNLVAHKLGPAIAAGNSVVLKPSSNAPRTALKLAGIMEASGLPKGAINVVTCPGGEADQLVTDERIKLITFTGSPSVGWGLKSRAGKKRVVLELGGNAGVIVDDDADLEPALGKIVPAAFGNAGQSCISVQRIYVHSSIAEEFTRMFLHRAGKLPVGDPEKEDTVVGPMIDEAAARRAEDWIHEAVEGGAKVLCGGKRTGAILQPTVLTSVNPGMKVCSQEVFAPVVTLEQFTDFGDAVRRINGSSFGLQAGIFSNNMKHVFAAYQDLEVGGVIVNETPTYRMDNMPYGGVKDSGFGREGLRYAIEEMTELKLLGLNLSS